MGRPFIIFIVASLVFLERVSLRLDTLSSDSLYKWVANLAGPRLSVRAMTMIVRDREPCFILTSSSMLISVEGLGLLLFNIIFPALIECEARLLLL